MRKKNKTKLMNDKKGQVILDLVIFIAVGIVVIVLAGVFIFAINTFTSKLRDVETPANDLGINITQTVDKTFGKVNDAYNQLNFVSWCIIIGMILSIFISYVFVRSHPVFFAGYLLVMILSIIFSVYISNAYENMVNTSGELASTFTGNTGGNFMLLHLPIWVAVIGIFGAILLFIGMTKDEGGFIGGI